MNNTQNKHYGSESTYFCPHGTYINVISVTPIRKVWPSLLHIFSKVTHSQQQYLQIPYTELQMLHTINVSGRNRNSFTPQYIAFTMLIFKELITQCFYGKPLYQTVTKS